MEFGEVLVWERLENKQASRVAIYRAGTIDATPDALREIRAWLIEKLLNFKAVFGDRAREELASGART